MRNRIWASAVLMAGMGTMSCDSTSSTHVPQVYVANSQPAPVRSVRPSERKAQQQRVDAALAELARSGDQISAARAGGFLEPLEQPLPDDALATPPRWLSYAPPFMGAVSIALFVLNSYGVFGEGPDVVAF